MESMTVYRLDFRGKHVRFQTPDKSRDAANETPEQGTKGSNHS